MTRAYWLTLFTVIISRLSLKILESNNVNKYAYVAGIRWHHFYTGILLVFLGLFIPKKFKFRAFAIYIGIGLVIDEAFFPLLAFGNSKFSYWYPGSIAIVAACLTLFILYHLKHIKKTD